MNDLLMLLAVTAAYSLVYMACCYDSDHWNGIDEDDDATDLDKFFNRLYFSVVTFSTVGYGDITPRSRTARLLVTSQIVCNTVGLLRMLLLSAVFK